MQGQKNKGNLCYLDGQALKRNHESKVKKKLKFSNVIKVFGDTSVGGEVCSLSNWLKNISLLAKGENCRVSCQKIKCMHIGNWIFLSLRFRWFKCKVEDCILLDET